MLFRSFCIKNKWRLHTTYPKREVPQKALQKISLFLEAPNFGGLSHLLIAFELEVDAKKVLQGEPWAFNRHLVVLQRYDDSVPVQELSFDKTSF